MWKTEPTSQWVKDLKWYEKKRPDELAAVSCNLKRYLAQLNAAPNPRAFMAGYIHTEPHGVFALDQKGGKPNLQETRLYVYPDEASKVLYLITIGNKDEQPGDIHLSKNFVESLKKTT